MNYKQKGFTLIELLVVIAIIGVLSTLAVTSLAEARNRSEDAARISEIRQIQNALELYYTDNGAYPDRVSGTVSYRVSTCPNNNFGGNWSSLTAQLAPYINLPQASVNSTDQGFSGLGLCYSYMLQSFSRCPDSPAGDQGYVLIWGSENETPHTYLGPFEDTVNNRYPRHYLNYMCSPK